jgi:hypothetical protein
MEMQMTYRSGIIDGVQRYEGGEKRGNDGGGDRRI